MDATQAPYNIFQIHINNTLQTLRFDPSPTGRNLLIWSGPFRAQGVLHASAGVQFDSQSAPPCSAATRGQFNYTAGGRGVKDSVQICAKDAGDNFAWRTLY